MDINNDENNNFYELNENFNIVIVGNNNVGKKSLIRRITNDKFGQIIGFFNQSYRQNNKKIIKRDNKTITLNFKEYNGLNCDKNSFLNCNAIAIILDLTSVESFRSISYWIENIKNNTNINFIVLVGTKCDLLSTKYVDDKKIQNLCKNYENNNLLYIETSAKTGKNINELSDFLIDNIYHYRTNKIAENNSFTGKNYNTFDNHTETIRLIKYDNRSNLKKILDTIFPCFEKKYTLL
jgi:small GTP-binding protein